MRAHEFLREYSIGDAKKQVANWIQNLDVNDEDHLGLLDKIYKVLNKDSMGDTIRRSIATPIDDEAWNDKKKKEVIDELAKIIFSLDSDVKTTHAFVDELDKGGVVNIKALMQPVNTFHNIFSSPLAIECFNELKAYGVGKQQKGPGEYAFAMLSDQIKLSTDGDLDIQGKLVELKAQQSTAGGRIGHTGRGAANIAKILSKYYEFIPTIANHIQTSPEKYISLTNFVGALNNDLPANTSDNKKIRGNIANDLYRPLFGSVGSLVKAFQQEDFNQIHDAYVTANWNWYIGKEPFDVLIAIAFKSGKTIAVKDAKTLLGLREAGHLNAFAISAYPSKAGGGREGFAQISIAAKKV